MKWKNIQDKINRKEILVCIVCFLLNAAILGMIRALYVPHPKDLYPGLVSVKTIIAAGVSGACMLIYIRNTCAFRVDSSILQFICACSYGLCAYVTMQENSLRALGIHAVFPLVFWALERMVYQEKHFAFILLCAAMLVINPEAGIPVCFLLFIWSLMELSVLGRLHPGEFLHTFGCYLLALLVSGAGILFYLAPYISERKEYGYPGYLETYSPTIFLSRFWPGATASVNFIGSHHRMDLYFGLFLMIAGILYFTRKEIGHKKKIYSAIFIVCIVAFLQLSPIQYVLQFCLYESTRTMGASFLLIFFLIRLAAEGLSIKERVSQGAVIAAVIVYSAWLIVSWLFGGQNMPVFFLGVHIVLGGVYFGWFLLEMGRRPVSGKKGLFRAGLLVIVLCEMGVSTYVNLNKKMLPDDISVMPEFVFAKEGVTEEADSKESNAQEQEAGKEEEYDDFLQQYEDEEMDNLLTGIQEVSGIQSDEAKKYCGKPFPNFFEMSNAACHKLGIQGDLFDVCDYDLEFDQDEAYTVVDVGNHIYYIDLESGEVETRTEIIPFHVILKGEYSGKLYQLDNGENHFLGLDSEKMDELFQDYIRVTDMDQGAPNVEILLYALNDHVYQEVQRYIDQYNESVEVEDEPSLLKYDYIGVIFSFIGAMMLFVLYGYDEKEKLYAKLEGVKKRLNAWEVPSGIYTYFTRNQVYWLSFLIPCITFLFCLIKSDCLPFGSFSYMDGDGSASILPLFLDNYYKYEKGNRFLSMNEGYGFDLSIYYTIHLLSLAYHYLPVSMIVPMMHFGMAVSMGICGFTMSYYMTHRLCYAKAAIKDRYVLISSLAYAMSSYMIGIHGYITWYFPLMIFPLLMLAMDYLMVRGKWTLYTALLAASILLEIQLSMFVCIYLVIRFFGYHFENGKDFWKRGLLFARSSLLAGGCSFMTVYRIWGHYQSSTYTDSDQVFPTPGLQGSFLEEWKKWMLFSSSEVLSDHDGDIVLFCGILTIILCGVFLLNKSVSLKEKVYRFVPIAFLLISFNGRVLGYLWNGLHYQAKVPNRYAFIFVFLLAELAYDSLHRLKGVSGFRFGLVSIFWMCLFWICQYGSEGNAEISFFVTICACVLYLMLYHVLHYRSYQKVQMLFLVLFISEMIGNVSYLTETNIFKQALIDRCGNYIEQADMVKKEFVRDGEFFRCIYPASREVNQGQIYDTGATTAFHSFLSQEQMTLQQFYGYIPQLNVIQNDYCASFAGASLSASRYIFYPMFSTWAVPDLSLYHYLGAYNIYYVYENKDAVALGGYVPDELIASQEYDTMNMGNVYNNLATAYGVNQNLFDTYKIHYDMTEKGDMGYYYIDKNGNRLTFEEAKDIVLKEKGEELTLHLSFEPEQDGAIYLNADQMIPLAVGNDGKVVADIPFERVGCLSKYYYTICYLNREVADDLFDVMKKEQIEQVSINNDTITGTIKNAKDGYVVLSLAYDSSWHIFLDGAAVKAERLSNGAIYFRVPSGKHELEMKYIPNGLLVGKLVTMGFWCLLLGGAVFEKFKNRRKAINV